jgi:GT2 family glycosyltransferase
MITDPASPTPSVSVVICAYTEDRLADLGAAVRSASEQHPTPAEVLVVIDHNAALLARATETFDAAAVMANRFAKGLSGARNTGVAAASGEIVAFLDDDAAARPGWLAALAAPFSDPDVMSAGGKVVPNWEDKAPPWLPEAFWWVVGCSYEGLPTEPAAIRNPIGANMAFRRDVLAEVGGFSESLGRVGKNPAGCEETELSIRASQCWPQRHHTYAPDAIVDHRVPLARGSWSYFVRRCYSEGLSKARVSALVGHQDGLRAERAHAFSVLPRSLVRSFRQAGAEASLAPLGQVGAIAAGLSALALGLARGRLHARLEDRDRRQAQNRGRPAAKPAARQPGATCVLDFRVGEDFPPIPARTPTGQRYERAAVLVRVGPHPAGTVTVDLSRSPTPGEVEATVYRQLAPAIARLEVELDAMPLGVSA